MHYGASGSHAIVWSRLGPWYSSFPTTGGTDEQWRVLPLDPDIAEMILIIRRQGEINQNRRKRWWKKIGPQLPQSMWSEWIKAERLREANLGRKARRRLRKDATRYGYGHCPPPVE